jgi:outer membrane protein
MKKPTLLCGLMLLVSSNCFCEDVPKEINLPRSVAIAMAVYRNLDLRNEAYNTEMAKKDLAKSWGIYNPVLNASGSGGVTAVPGDPFFSTKFATTSLGLTQNLPTGGSITASTQTGFFSFNPGTSVKDWQSTAGLSLTQPLLRNFGMENTQLNITMSANSLQESVERFRTSTAETVANVVTTYNHLYVLRKILETKVASLSSAQKLLDSVSKKTHQAPVKVMEIANAEFATAQRRKDVVEASRNVRDQEVSLRYMIGMESKTEIIPIEPPSREEPPQTEEQAVKSALEIRNDLKQLLISLQSTKLQESIARRQAWPDLSVNATGGFTGTGASMSNSYGNLWNDHGNYWTAGLQLSIPLGNTTLRNEYLKSKIKTEQLETQIRILKWKIQNDVESDLRALISARLQIQLAEKSLVSAEQRLEAYRKNNEAGTATIQDVINAENDKYSADNAQLEAAENFANAVTKLWKDTGLLLDRYNVHIDVTVPEKITERVLPKTPESKLPLTDSSVAKMVESGESRPAPDGGTPTPAVAAEKPAAPGGSPTNSEVPPGAQIEPGTDAPNSLPRIKPPLVAEPVQQEPLAKPETTGKGPANLAAPMASGVFTLKIGEYADKSQMSEPIQKLKRSGLITTVKQGPKKITPLIRLLVAEFPDQGAATQALNKLRAATAQGFILKSNAQKYALYAGSHFDRKSALREQARLSRNGVATSLKSVSVPLPTFVLTAGSFPTREGALAEAAKLEKQDLKPVVVEIAP